ncbi:MAG: DUF3320 domain-containing protein [Sporichthyaceae bacterium]
MTVEIELRAIPFLSYAMAHNRIPVVAYVGLRSGVTAAAAELHVRVVDDEGPLTHEHRQLVELQAGELTELDRPAVRLDPAKLLQVRHTRPGWVEVELRHDGAVLATARTEVQVLAGAHWLSVPDGLAPSLLAAHVLPHDPAVAALLAEASALLRERTADPSLQGYQDGPGRVDAIVEAIWDAAAARRISYSTPPASWRLGQVVRTPAEVFEGRVGTCLDTTVALAAALEQAGINPLLWLIDGHAFLAYWRVDTALDAPVYDDPAEVVNLVDLDAIRLVETTAVCETDRALPFAATARLAANKIADLSVVKAIVDVFAARAAEILPLPVRRQADGVVQVVEYSPAAANRQLVFAPRAGAASAPGRGDVPPRVQQWKNSLLDLSLRNRLINYTDRSGVRLHVPGDGLGTFEDIVSAGKSIVLRPLDQIEAVDAERGVRDASQLPPDRLTYQLVEKTAVWTDVASGGYLTRLRGLAHRARTIEEETGANNLYLTLGSLVWNVDGKPLRSPLILVPVRLSTSARGQLYRVTLDESGAATPNYCLLEKLRTVGLTIPKLAEPDLDHSGIDLPGVLQATREAIAATGLPYRVEPSADLAILAFAKFRLWKDLDEHWEAMLANPLVHHLVHTPTHPFADPVPAPSETNLDELDALCPIAADASQLTAVAEAVAGRTFVLEGPPGTGKSQTITNLLVRAVASGKRVLFVAEKRAALDVVASRLASVGMGPFALDLHDKGAKPAVVRAQIRRAMEHRVEVDADGLAAASHDLRSGRRALERYAQRLHEPNGAALSYYGAHARLLALGADGPTLPVPATALQDAAALENARRALRGLVDAAELARPHPNHPWGFLGHVGDPDAARRIAEAARAVDAALAGLPATGPLADAVAAAGTPDQLAALAALVGSPTPLPLLEAAGSPGWRTEADALGAAVAQVARHRSLLDRVQPGAFDLPLDAIHADARAADDANLFVRKKRRRAVLDQLAGVLRTEVEPDEVGSVVASLLVAQGEIRALAARAAALPGVQVPPGWNPVLPDAADLVDRQIRWLRWAGHAVAAAEGPFGAALRAWLGTGPAADAAAAAAVSGLAEPLRVLAAGPGFAAWLGKSGIVARWRDTAARRWDELGLARWLAFQEALVPLRSAGLGEAVAALEAGTVPVDEASSAFERGLAHAALEERRVATGLDGFDPLAHDRAVLRFSESAVTVREKMGQAAPAEVLAARGFSADSAKGMVGELRREISRQRGGLQVRALLAKHGELIVELMPCVLVSPDSVSRFFPADRQIFDLVVFDEASQIRVADAVGAMGRAGSVVVVGDSKQMPPTTFGESGLDEEADEVLDLGTLVDQESILSEATEAAVPQRWLTWHYRSRDESLIAFSNAYYYGGKLSSFPAPVHPNADRLSGGYGLSLVRVNGQFQRSGKGKLLRTNPVEADAILAEIQRRFAASPDALPSLGVVTFNLQQRTYIEELIRDTQDERLVAALEGRNGEGLFVKNLENVQGDERDVILFSTAFSVNDNGVLPLNFGPLTRAGGERRLNVAITRARRQVVVFSSFDPGQLRVEATQSLGIRHLRAYLEMAATGAHSSTGAVRPKAVPDRHRDEVAAALRGRGLVVETDVGLSDFRVDLTLATAAEPTKPLVAVLLDGPGWAARRTVGDRDGLPVAVLGGLMRWPGVERVWLPAWRADREGTVARLLQAVGDAEKVAAGAADAGFAEQTVDLFADLEPDAETGPVESAPPPPPAPTKRAGLPGQETFLAHRATVAGGRDVLDALPAPWAVERVRNVLREVVAREAPIHAERLAKAVAASFDLNRMSKDRMQAILAALPADTIRDRDEDFVWAPGAVPETWTTFRVAAGGDQRDLDQICLREIGNAMVALCRDSGGMSSAELSTETLALFGGKRKTAGIAIRLDEAREDAVRRGILRPADGDAFQAL